MNPSFLPLLGVVVGALLGGGAQLLASHVQDRQRHRQWLRERRAESYKDFARVAEEKLHGLGDYFAYYFDEGEPPEDYVVVVYGVAADVSFFGSDEATVLATEVAEALLELLSCARDNSNRKYDVARKRIDAFRSQARRDIVTG